MGYFTVISIKKNDILSAERVNRLFILFNDTHGSGKQFVSDFSDFIDLVGAENVLIVCLSITNSALDRFKNNLPEIKIIPEVPTPTLFELNVFTQKEIKMIAELGNKVYPEHPNGYDGVGLLVAYYYQCPNNNLPIVWANGLNNSYTKKGSINEGVGYPWVPLYEYMPKQRHGGLFDVSSCAVTRSIKEIDEEYLLVKIDRIPQKRRRAINKLLKELDGVLEKNFESQELLVRILKQKYKDTGNRKEYFSTLEKAKEAIKALLDLSKSEIQQVTSYEILAEFAVDYSQYAIVYADLNSMVSQLNQAIQAIGRQIYLGQKGTLTNHTHSYMLCLRSKCRRALASIYNKRARRDKAIKIKIHNLRNDALRDSERAFNLERNHRSELEYVLSMFACSATTESVLAKKGYKLLESIGEEGNNVMALYELVKQRRMRQSNKAAVELFLEIAQKDYNHFRSQEYVGDFTSAIMGMYYEGYCFEEYMEYAIYACNVLDAIIQGERYRASHLVDKCYMNAILGEPPFKAIEPLSNIKANSELAWNQLAQIAKDVTMNTDFTEALLLGLEDPIIWGRIGTFYKVFMRDYYSALAFYERALKINKRMPNMYYNKALVYTYDLKDFKQARISLSSMYSLKEFMYGWYMLLKRDGKLNKLEQDIEKGLNE